MSGVSFALWLREDAAWGTAIRFAYG